MKKLKSKKAFKKVVLALLLSISWVVLYPMIYSLVNLSTALLIKNFIELNVLVALLVMFPLAMLFVFIFFALKRFFNVRSSLDGFALAVTVQLACWFMLVAVGSVFAFHWDSFLLGVPIILFHGILLNYFDKKVLNSNQINHTT